MLKCRNAWDSPGSGRWQISHTEMDEDVDSVSRTPGSPDCFNHIGTWLRWRRKERCRDTTTISCQDLSDWFLCILSGPWKSTLQATAARECTVRCTPKVSFAICCNQEKGPSPSLWSTRQAPDDRLLLSPHLSSVRAVSPSGSGPAT